MTSQVAQATVTQQLSQVPQDHARAVQLAAQAGRPGQDEADFRPEHGNEKDATGSA